MKRFHAVDIEPLENTSIMAMHMSSKRSGLVRLGRRLFRSHDNE